MIFSHHQTQDEIPNKQYWLDGSTQ